jgi:sulfonate transport system permease protein
MTDLAATLSDPQEATAERPVTGTFGNLFYASSLTQWWVPLGILVVWQVSSSAGWLPTRFLPAPLDILAAAYKVTVNGDLPKNIAVSFQRAVSGFLLGGSIAFALGLANGLSKTSETLLDSTLQMVRNIPNLALIPLVILWFGIDEGAKLFLTAFGVFFPIYINTFHGVRTVDPQLIEMARSYDMSPFDLFRRVILPGALPSIFVGIRYALGIMWLTLIVAETIAADAGIGHMAMQAREFMQLDIVVFAVLVYALLGKAADGTTRFLERRCLVWHPAYQRS